MVLFSLVLRMCENRQQPTWILGKRVAKDGVHACVLRIFFFVLHNCAGVIIITDIQKQNQKWHAHTIPFFFVFFVFEYLRCARIDNNRREYWEEKARKDGVHACVLHIFFSLRSFLRIVCVERLLQLNNEKNKKLTKQLILFFCCLVCYVVRE